MHKLPDLRGALDLTATTCEGCRWRRTNDVCQRFPPVFMAASMVRQGDGSVALTQGGWSFPPAMLRCGEYEIAPGVN